MHSDKLRIAEEVYGPALKEQAAIRHTAEAKTWKDLAYRAFQKQLASKKNAPEGALFKDNPSSKESLAKE